MSLVLLGILNSQAAAGGGEAYDLLETQVLTGTASSITFTGLGSYSDYKHLQIRAVAKTNRSATNENTRLQINSDTGSDYSRHQLRGTGSSVVSEAATSQTSAFIATIAGATSDSDSFSVFVSDILDFSSGSKNTTIRTLYGGLHNYTEIGLSSGAYFDTSAVTSLELILQSGGSFVSGSRFSLMGVR